MQVMPGASKFWAIEGPAVESAFLSRYVQNSKPLGTGRVN